MQDELVLADSAGHTMIKLEAARALDRAALWGEPRPAKEQEKAPPN